MTNKIIQKASHVKWPTKSYLKLIVWKDQQNYTQSESWEMTDKILRHIADLFHSNL